MSAKATMLSLLKGEVFRVDEGTDRLLMLQERASEREAERARLRGLMDQSHPQLPLAVRRRRKVM